MATTFEVLFLGNVADLDPTEGNTTTENASALVGMTFGSQDEALAYNAQHVMSPIDTSAVDPAAYDEDNTAANDTFSIDGGPAQTFDSVVIYDITLSYVDGTPDAVISGSIMQDTDGNLYLVPEYSTGPDVTAMQAAPIASITVDAVNHDASWMFADRVATDFLCFTHGTHILTETGNTPVEALRPGQMVYTRDNGFQPLRWIGRRRVAATGANAPVRFEPGALGNDRALLISPQHRVLLSGWRVQLYFGAPEVLAPAKAFVNGTSVQRRIGGEVDYVHILFDRHEVVISEGVATESFHPNGYGLGTLDRTQREELYRLFPELRSRPADFGRTARPCLRPREAALVAPGLIRRRA